MTLILYKFPSVFLKFLLMTIYKIFINDHNFMIQISSVFYDINVLWHACLFRGHYIAKIANPCHKSLSPRRNTGEWIPRLDNTLWVRFPLGPFFRNLVQLPNSQETERDVQWKKCGGHRKKAWGAQARDAFLCLLAFFHSRACSPGWPRTGLCVRA